MKIKVFAVTLLTLAIPIVAVVATANAQTFRSDQSVTISNDDVINGSAYLAGSSVNVSGKVDGDLYCAGQNVNISGEITGDVLCAGQTLTISGTVTGNVRLAGQTMALSGKVGKSASIVGQTITLHKDGEISQDVTIIGQNTNIDGRIGRDLALTSVVANINSTIGRNVNADLESLTLAKGAAIGGALTYTAPKKLTASDGSVVSGKTTYTEAKDDNKKSESAFNPFAAFIWSLMLLVSALLFALLFPRFLHDATQLSSMSVSKVLLATLVGFVASVVMPVAIILLMITVLGIPFAIATLVAWILVVMLSGAFAAYYIGHLVWSKQSNTILIMLVGALILVIALLVPILNVLVWLFSIWFGSGAILLYLRKQIPAPRYNLSKTAVRSKK